MVGGLVFARELYHYWVPRRVGVYGPTMVGKTTLDKYLTTPGEMEDIPIENRTSHTKILGKYLLPRATRKRVRWKGVRRVVHSSDMGGEERFWNLWIDDMVNRNVEAVVFMLTIVCVWAENLRFKRLRDSNSCDALIHRQYRYRNLRARLRGKKYCPKTILLVANKADQWWDDQANVLWQQRLGEHKIFDQFREDLVRLQKQAYRPYAQ